MRVSINHPIIGCLLFAASNASTLHAESADGQQDSALHGRRVLEEVVVTATKREKSLRDIPASISAVSGEDLESQAVLSINDVLEQVPGVTSNASGPGDQRIVMRGVSTSASPSSTVPYPVGIFIGETSLNEPYAASITPDLSAFDLAAVEVLKGPQGTLFGGAALSGVLRYRLNDPVPDQWQARYFAQNMSVEEGSQALTQGVAINVPLLGEGGDLGMRLTYINREYPGVTDDLRLGEAGKDVNEGEGEQFRAAILWQPTDELLLKFAYLNQDYASGNALILANSPDGPRSTSGSLIPWPSRHEFTVYNLDVQYDWESVRMVSSSSRTEKERYKTVDSYGEILGIPPDNAPTALALPFESDQKSSSFQQEIRFQSRGGESFEWLAGAYYLHSPIDYGLKLNAQILNDTSSGLDSILDSVVFATEVLGLGDIANQALESVKLGTDDVSCELSLLCASTDALAEEKALFFDASWRPVSRLELSLGGRLYRTTVSGGFIGRGIGARLSNDGVSPASLETTITEEGFNPKFSATFDFTDEHSLYFLANKGFRFGGIQTIPEDELQNVPATYKSDYIWNYELGLRTRWFDNSLELDITGFYIEYIDPLVVLKTAFQINYYDNVDGAESSGLEVNMRWLTPIPGVAFSFAGGTVDAHTTEDFLAGQDEIAAGKPLPGSAEYQYSAALSVTGSSDWMVNVSGLLSYTYVGKTYNDIVSEDIVNDYATYNFGLNFSVPTISGRPTLSLNIQNLTDETAPVNLISAPVGDKLYILNSPRTVSARFSLEFE